MALEVRRLASTDADAAMDLCREAFLDEPFIIDLFGDDRDERRRGAAAMFSDAALGPHDFLMGVHADDRVVGVALVSPSGHCHVCAESDAPPRAGMPMAEWEFLRDVATAHAALGTHGWIGKVAVDPAEQGRGIGRSLVAAAVKAVNGDVLLECQPHRQAFYESCGFVPVGAIPDPPGPDAGLMLHSAGRLPS